MPLPSDVVFLFQPEAVFGMQPLIGFKILGGVSFERGQQRTSKLSVVRSGIRARTFWVNSLWGWNIEFTFDGVRFTETGHHTFANHLMNEPVLISKKTQIGKLRSIYKI